MKYKSMKLIREFFNIVYMLIKIKYINMNIYFFNASTYISKASISDLF